MKVWIDCFKDFEWMEFSGVIVMCFKKEGVVLWCEFECFQKYLGGFKNMCCFFDVVVLVDQCCELNVVFEVCKFDIFLVFMLDINCDLDFCEVLIFCNDDVVCLV